MPEWFELESEKRTDVLMDKYRHVFLGSDIGKEVLGDILQVCHFGCTLDPDNKVQVSEYNVATHILSKCGIFAPGTLKDVMNALASVMPDPDHV
jgi:hypothetical protein